MFYFVGDFPEDVQHYSTAPTIAGTNYIFTAPSRACDNCGIQAEAGLRVSDSTPITPILLDYVSNGTLSSLYPIDVVPFLKTNLHWRTVGVSGAVQGVSTPRPLSLSPSHIDFSGTRYRLLFLLAIHDGVSRLFSMINQDMYTNEFQANNTQPTPSNEVDGLEVSVSSSVAYLHPGEPVPEPIAAQDYPEVTAGRAGGILV